MRRSSFGPSNNAPASVVGEEPVDADQRKLAGADAVRSGFAGAPAADDEDPRDDEDVHEDARRARWTALVTGFLLALSGLAAAAARLGGGLPARVPAAYALGSAVCAAAGVLGARGRTRRALWLMILGVMVMALGDQFD
ncbi:MULTISPECIES: hypothetical protein [unclassified Streptomyces]|uniref:hypothetical protein n=1 Tax=unclassified Streptomyces TaxID=2593676 RepID=UPI003435413F